VFAREMPLHKYEFPVFRRKEFFIVFLPFFNNVNERASRGVTGMPSPTCNFPSDGKQSHPGNAVENHN